nr:MAG: hypothetical protein [Caudoviricetes sp.]
MDKIVEGTRAATMKFSDAHNILTDIGYSFNRQSGSSHKVYSKPNKKNIILSPHGKDVSASSTREVYNALKVHKLREAILNNDLVISKQLIEEILANKIYEKLQEKKLEIASMMFEGNPETKKVAKRIYRKLGKKSRDSGDMSRSITASGRKLVSSLHPDQIRAILATEDTVSEQENPIVIKMRRHIRFMHPHLAREKNLDNRQKLDRKIDSIERKINIRK